MPFTSTRAPTAAGGAEVGEQPVSGRSQEGQFAGRSVFSRSPLFQSFPPDSRSGEFWFDPQYALAGANAS